VPTDVTDLHAIEAILEGSTVWGLELDTEYRVLAGTFEVAVGRHPVGPVRDRRLQVLAFPVSEILASLRRTDEDGSRRVERFTVDQLLEVSEAVAGAVVHGPMFRQPRPAPGAWGPEPSLRGQSNAPDGRSHSLTLHLAAPEGGVTLDLRVTFDEITLRTPEGRDLTQAELSS
jgi:hypothetical protein